MQELGTRARSLARSALALVVLLVAAWVLLELVVGVVAALAWTVVGVLAVVALLWALKALLW